MGKTVCDEKKTLLKAAACSELAREAARIACSRLTEERGTTVGRGESAGVVVAVRMDDDRGMSISVTIPWALDIEWFCPRSENWMIPALAGELAERAVLVKEQFRGLHPSKGEERPGLFAKLRMACSW